MNAEEVDRAAISNKDEGDTVVRISNGTFEWDSKMGPVLENINVEVKRNQLVAVVGQVGSGKSSLISLLLNELSQTNANGEVNVNGKISYVPQQAWMQNATVKSNITFGKEFVQEKYKRIVEACALEEECYDRKVLPNGDMTEIGEKGINLSGGQKQRISLARAVYNDGDIYMLDDPLSAVDVHVGKHLFEKVIGPEGLLRNKTRILVTHGVKFLPYVDKIIVLKDKKISEMGTYQELITNGNDFADFLNKYSQDPDNDSETSADAEAGEEEEEAAPTCTEVPFSALMKAVASFKKRKLSRRKDPEDQAQLITSESVETSAVGRAVNVFYFREVGLRVCCWVLALNLLQQLLAVGTSVCLSSWSDNPHANTPHVRNLYLGSYALLGSLTSVGIAIVAVLTAIGGLNASTRLHNKMLHSVLRAPLSFFDTNPKGRIVNRFAKDIDYIDRKIPKSWADLVNYAVATLATLAVVCYTLPVFIAIIVVCSVGYWLLQESFGSSNYIYSKQNDHYRY